MINLPDGDERDEQLNKRQYLKEMGIDIWVHRSAMSLVDRAEPAVVASGAAQVLKAIAPSDPQTALQEKTQPAVLSTGARGPAPSFKMVFMHYGSAGIVLMLGKGDRVPRRFCDDVARTLEGDTANLLYQELEWPMVKNSAIDQSVTAAKEVVSQKMLKMPEKLILVGEEIRQYYEPAKQLDAIEPGRSGRHQLLLIDSLAEIMGTADKKRRLMMVFQNWK